MFKHHKVGLLCKSCSQENLKTNSKIKSKDENGSITVIETELKSFKIIKSLINSVFDVERTVEGCLIDIIIKPKYVENLWLPIQLKSSQINNKKTYSFYLNNRYDDILLCLHNINDNKFWLIDYNSVKDITQISIGLNNSKYNKFQVIVWELPTKLIDFYEKYKLVTREFSNIPISESQQREQLFRKIREDKVKILNFEYPESVKHYDFIVNGKKVQEKTGSILKSKEGIVFNLQKYEGRTHQVPYDKHDNDLYWLNMPDKNIFFAIPTTILYDNGYLRDDS